MRGVGRSDINLDVETEAVTRVRHIRVDVELSIDDEKDLF